MSLGVDIRVLGVPELERKLRNLAQQVQRKIVRQALRKSAVRTKKRVVDNLSGDKVQVQTGNLRGAFRDAKIRGTTRRGMIRVGIVFPERDKLGIAPDDPYYYPTAVEYGHGNVPAYSYMRTAIDDHKKKEYDQIAKDIGAGIEKEAGK